MESLQIRYSGPAMARKIAQNYGKSAKTLSVTMVGTKDVAALIKRIDVARSRAFRKPLKFD